MNTELDYTIPAEEPVNPDSMNFKEYIQYKMKAVPGKNGRKTITAAQLAESLGMSTKVFQEILNGRRAGPDRRDFVIALCAELGLDGEETDDALRLFPPALRTLSKEDPRDRAILRVLNADFDEEISCAGLNRQLRRNNLPPLKIRYRTLASEEGRSGMIKNKINWAFRSEEERERYNYYTSLNYDDLTATVLALYTYGDQRITAFSLKDAYRAFAEDKPYPPNWDLEPPVIEGKLSGPGGQIGGGISGYTQAAPPGMAFDLDFSIEPEMCSYTSVDEDAEDIPLGADLDMDFMFNVDDDEPELSSAPGPAAPAHEARDTGLMFQHRSSGKMFRGKKAMYDPPKTDEYHALEEKPFRDTLRELTSTFRMTTSTASAGIILNQLRNGCAIDRGMVRIEEMLNYFRYRQPKPEKELFRISTELKDRENGNKLLYINVQGREEVKEQQNIVVVLDVSGSMGDNAEQTQAIVATIVSKLKTGDTFSLITYSDKDETVIDGLKVGDKTDIRRILEKLLGLEIDGCTYGSAGIETAYRIGRRNYIPDGNNQVILITDGDLNFGITDEGGLEKLIEEKKKDNLFLSVIGTGLDNYKDNKLEVLSKHGNGVYRVVNNLNDVKKSVRDEYASLVNIIAKDVKAQVEFNPEVVESFRLLGFENRELKHRDFTDDTVISEPFGSGGYGVALYELVMTPGVGTKTAENRYTRVVTTGSEELGVVRVRYKEPLAETSHEIEHVIAGTEENWTDNLLLAWVVYVCAEKLRDSVHVSARDEALALADFERLGMEVKVLNLDDLDKLREILTRSRELLGVRVSRNRGYRW